MDGSTFDRLTRAVGASGSRRRLLGVLASVGLGGLLIQLDDDEGAARRKRSGRKRSHRPGKAKDNRKGKRKGKRKGLGGADPDSCTKGTECASGACCQGACCQAPSNQCNPEGLCCAPNCAGRQCGTDGCGGDGACGTCANGQTCNEETGQCEGSACTAHLQPCTSSNQCCATDHTACKFNNWVVAEDVCCSTLGGACTTGGPSGDCCVLNDDYAYCSPEGACGGQGAVCRFDDVCVSGQCCKAHPSDDHGVCSGPDGCCRAHLASCTSADQCCSTENTACTYNNWVIAEDVCCSTLGGPCSTGGPSGDCCVLNDDYAYCSPEGTCGGQGAECRFDDVCLSGHCCKANPNDDHGVCSGPGGC